MAFNSWAAFFAMQPYGFYVWAAFGLTFSVLLVLLLEPVLTRRSLLKQLKNNTARELRMQAAKNIKDRL